MPLPGAPSRRAYEGAELPSIVEEVVEKSSNGQEYPFTALQLLFMKIRPVLRVSTRPKLEGAEPHGRQWRKVLLEEFVMLEYL
jgi:hypothetical protein